MPLFTREIMQAFILEALPEAEMTAIEKATRWNPVAQALHRELLAAMDAGEHSVGGIWRRERLSCPTREQLGSYALGTGEAELWQYIDFHIQSICCEWCIANLDDLRRHQQASDKAATKRRKQIFASSAGLLPKAGRR